MPESVIHSPLTPIVFIGSFDALGDSGKKSDGEEVIPPLNAEDLLLRVGEILANGEDLFGHEMAYGIICDELEPRIDWGPVAAQAALRPLMGFRRSLEDEAIASQILLTRLPDGRSLRDVRRPITGKTVDYYGITFELSGHAVGKYSVSELELGVLALVNEGEGDQNGRIEKVAIAPPDNINYQDPRIIRERATLVEPKDLDAAILGGRRIPGFAEDAEAFFADFHDFFDERPWTEKPSGRMGLVDFIRDYEYGKMQATNMNFYNVEAKYLLWKLFSPYQDIPHDPQLHAIRTAMSFFDVGNPIAQHVVTALGGDRALIISVGNRLGELNRMYTQAFGQEQDVIGKTGRLFGGLIQEIANAETFIVEGAWAMLPDEERGRYQERVNLILPLIHGMAREAMESFAQDRSPEELEKVLTYHLAGLKALQDMIKYVFATYHPQEEAPDAAFSLTELDDIRAGSRLAPKAGITHDILVRHAYAKGMYAQRNISIEERQAWLQAFYERVIAMGVYEARVAKEYKDVSGLEEERYKNALISLRSMGLVPEKSRLLSVGCGDGAMEGRVYEALAKNHPEALPGSIIGLDAFMQGEKTFWRKKSVGQVSVDFLHTSLEDVLAEHSEFEGSFDMISLIGSPLNNMDLLVMQRDYFVMLNRLLKPGGIVMFETGLAEPARNYNERWQAIQSFLKISPGKPFGTIGIKPIYQSESDKPEDPGAYLYLTSIFEAIEKISGLKLIRPSTMEDLVRAGDNLDELLRQTREVRDAFKQPVYIANPPEELTKEVLKKLLNIRGAIFFQKVGEPVTDDPFLSPLARATSQKGPGIRS